MLLSTYNLFTPSVFTVGFPTNVILLFFILGGSKADILVVIINLDTAKGELSSLTVQIFPDANLKILFFMNVFIKLLVS